MQRLSLLFSLAVAALIFAGCGVGTPGPDAKISETTDTYLRSLASGDMTKACAQLTADAKAKLGPSCTAALQTIRARVGPDRLTDAADKGSSISVDGPSGSATLKGLNAARLGLVKSGSNWLLDSGYALDGGS